jgi:hypothetical protein
MSQFYVFKLLCPYVISLNNKTSIVHIITENTKSRVIGILYHVKIVKQDNEVKHFLKVVTSEKIGGSGVISTLGTWYGGVVMGVLLPFNEAAILYRHFNQSCE